MTAPTDVIRTLFARGSRFPRAVIGRVRNGGHRRASPQAIPVQITLDGTDLLSWRSPDITVQGIMLRASEGDAPASSPALDATGPPHGVLHLDGIARGAYKITARASGRERTAVLLPAGDGTRNETRSPEGGSWQLENSLEPCLVYRSPKDEDPGLLALEAAHGLIALDVGPLLGSWMLTLERRGAANRIPVEPRPSTTGAIHIYRLGAKQWSAAALPADGEVSVWDVILRDDDEPGRRVRLAWRGSGIERPRDALRVRATVSHTVPGQRVEVRPYWTKDQYLALELTATPSIGGDPA